MACCLELILVRLLFLNYICGIETLHVVSKRLIKFLKSHTVMLEKPFIFFSILLHVISKIACVVLTLHHVVSEPHHVASKIHTLWKQSHTIFFQLFLFHDMCSQNCHLWFRVCVMLSRNDTVLL